MGRLALISCLLLTVAGVTAQTAQAQVERLLPQWLTGTIAVSAFLFVVFVSLLVKKAWCENSRRESVKSEASGIELTENEVAVTNGNTYNTTLDMVRSSEKSNAYENPAMDSTDHKVTPI